MKFINMNKKGMTWQYLVGGILALFILIFVIIIFTRGGEKTFGDLSDRIDALADCDDDGVANMFDKCDCDPTIGDKLEDGKECSKKCSETDEKNCAECGKLSC